MLMNLPGPTLASRLLPAGRIGAALRAVLLVAAGTALLTLSAKVSVPFYPVNMTLQTFTVLMIGAVYGPRLGLATVLAYFAEGFVGLPVFTSTPPLPAGPGYFMGPTAGFMAGFLVTVTVAGIAVQRGLGKRPVALFGAMLAAQAVLFGLGLLWLSQFAVLPTGTIGLGLVKSWHAAIAPFLLGDVVKTALAALLVAALCRKAEQA
jgi:biotin transport system substrate-specific component